MEKILKYYGVLTVLTFSLLVVAGNAEANTQADVKKTVVDEAIKNDFSPALALAVARVESDFDNMARSSKGARGVMQIMPMTAKVEFDVDERQLWDARLNSRVGIRYLQKLIARYGKLDLALSHYNGGTLSCQRGECMAHPYTRKYVEDVFKWKKHYEEQAYVWNVNSKHGTEQDAEIIVKEVPEPATKKAKMDYASLSDQPPVKRVDRNHYDYGESMQQRRLRIRESLDDFTPSVHWAP